MSDLDLIALNSSDKQDLIIELLVANQAMLIVLMDRERERLAKEYGMTADEAQAFMTEQYADARAARAEGYGIDELPEPRRDPKAK